MSPDRQAVFGSEPDESVLHAKAGASQHGPFIFQSEVPVARRVASEIRYLAFDPDLQELPFDQNLYLRGQLGDRQSPALLHQLFKEA